ncbi:MAG: hypothetical protein ACKOJF_32960, partial [Planctomycetaceae bacterium]
MDRQCTPDLPVDTGDTLVAIMSPVARGESPPWAFLRATRSRAASAVARPRKTAMRTLSATSMLKQAQQGTPVVDQSTRAVEGVVVFGRG